jgi:hypothetical protein
VCVFHVAKEMVVARDEIQEMKDMADDPRTLRAIFPAHSQLFIYIFFLTSTVILRRESGGPEFRLFFSHYNLALFVPLPLSYGLLCIL